MRIDGDGRGRRSEQTIPSSSLSWLTGLVAEQTTLLGSLVKWTAPAVAVGLLAGCATTPFLSVLDWAMAAMARAPARLLWLPFGFAAAHMLVRVPAPDAAGHGTDKVIGVYPSQILGIAKTLSVRIPRRVEVGDLAGYDASPLRFPRLTLIAKVLRRLGIRR